MTTYAESKGAKPFDWNEFLERARRGETSEQELNLARVLAGNWITCACGTKCDVLPRDLRGCPKDVDLAKLGLIFQSEVLRGDWGFAQLILADIESRSAELLAQMNEGKGGR